MNERLEERKLQIGFTSDADCAPIVVAKESGLFEKYELEVELHRETRWASIRDKIIDGELDAAHTPATLPFITNLGLDSDRCACVTGLVMSLQGNAIVISRELSDAGVSNAGALRELVYSKWGRRTFTLGVVFPHSPAYFLLRDWLKQGGIIPGIEVRIVIVPPAQLFPMLKLGYIDGFCGGEPWSSLSVESGAGRCLATSGGLVPLHPEKVLMVRRDFAEGRAHEHERLAAALLEACAFCDQPSNHAVLAEMLSRPQYVNAPAESIRHGLSGFYDPLPVSEGVAPGRMIFHGFNANEPSDSKATWLVERLYELMEENVLRTHPLREMPVIKNVFRRDIYQRAREMLSREAQTVRAETAKLGADPMPLS